MSKSIYSHLSKEEILELEQDWSNREIVVEGLERQDWLNDGIKLYRKFLKIKGFDAKDQVKFRTKLANLYLAFGRDEKIRMANFQKASTYLFEAARYDPENPLPYYHLAFLMENLQDPQRKWEAIGFYAKESLEKGIAGVRKIKLLALLGMAYGKIGLSAQGDQYFKEATQLDEDGYYKVVIERYSLESKKSKGLFFITGSYTFTNFITTQDYDDYHDQALDGKCCILDLTKEQYCFIGDKDTVPLANKEAELLAFLIEQKAPCPKRKIESYIWEDQDVTGSTVKKYISTLRKKISECMKECETDRKLIETTQLGYQWNSQIPTYVIRS